MTVVVVEDGVERTVEKVIRIEQTELQTQFILVVDSRYPDQLRDNVYVYANRIERLIVPRIPLRSEGLTR